MFARAAERMEPILAIVRSPRFRWTFAGLFIADIGLAALHLWNAFTRHAHPQTLIAHRFFNPGDRPRFGRTVRLWRARAVRRVRLAALQDHRVGRLWGGEPALRRGVAGRQFGHP